MILEISFSLMSPRLWGFYFGWKTLAKDEGPLAAESLVVKFLPFMFQFTIYTINDED